jgi:hypothetical protein
MKYKYRNLQFKTVSAPDGGCQLAQENLEKLQQLQEDDWEVHHTVPISGDSGITSHLLFMLRREIKL